MKKRKLWLKRVMSLTIVVVMAFSFNCLALSSQKKVDTPHAYTVVPGSDEWASMSVQQRLASCKVTQAEVEMMTTEALIETVVNYPYLVNMYAYNDLGTGIKMVSNHFPGIKELLSRADAVRELEKSRRSIESRTSELEESKVMDKHYISSLLYIAKNTDGYAEKIDSVPRYTVQYVTTPHPGNSSVQVYYNFSWANMAQIYGLRDENGNWYNEDQVLDYVSSQRAKYLQTYPTAGLIATASPKYNCFSYAWYLASTSNMFWMHDCSAYVTDGSYYSTSAAVGRKITYTVDGSMSHAGIVTGTNAYGQLVITSKWGMHGLYTHPVSDCPYTIDAQHPGNVLNIQYWARTA